MEDRTEVMEPGELTLAGRSVSGPMKAQDIIAHVALVEQIKRAVMKEGVHYGTIPGCPKPSLYKPGAEMLLMAFRLCSDHEITLRELGDGHREYTTRTYVKTSGGLQLAVGIGICSTMESKYRYRIEGRKCPSCGKESIIKGKEEFGGGWICFKKKNGCGEKFEDGDAAIESQTGGKVENPDLADVYHTVLQMSKKRSLVCGTRTATACSDFFAQDLEDLKREADRVEKDEHGDVDVWLRKIESSVTADEVKKTRADAFAWIADMVKRNRMTAACTARLEAIAAEAAQEGGDGDPKKPPKRRTLKDVVTGGGKSNAAAKAVDGARKPETDPDPQDDEAATAADDDSNPDADFDGLMTTLRDLESELPPDAVETAYNSVSVSPSIEDHRELSIPKLRQLVDALSKITEKRKKDAKKAAPTTTTSTPRALTEAEQIRFVARARMDKPTEYAKALARMKVSAGLKPSEMTETTRLAVIFDAFGSNLPDLK